MAQQSFTVTIIDENSSTVVENPIVKTSKLAAELSLVSDVNYNILSVQSQTVQEHVVLNIGPAGAAGVQGPQGEQGDGLLINATGLFSERTTYDTEAMGFSFVATDQGLLYFRETITDGIWSPGIPFSKGDPGESAYELAVLAGFSGTESEWLASIKGDTGEIGETGPAGVYTGPTIFVSVSEPVEAVSGDIWIEV